MIAVHCCLFLEEYEINGRKIRESTVVNLQFLPTTPHISSSHLAGQSLLDLIKSPQVISLHRPISSRGGRELLPAVLRSDLPSLSSPLPRHHPVQ
ncbi:hypothetical protein SRHO_G00266510 [Serrasalmus rhombeus]